jgi:hypothetical protein
MYRNPVFYPQTTGSSGSSLILLFGMILFLLVIVVIVLLLWKTPKPKTQEERDAELLQMYEQLELDLNSAAENAGIDPNDLKEELYKPSELSCYVYPENGVCNSNFYNLVNGCCELKDGSKSNNELRNEMIFELTKEIMYPLLAEYVIVAILPRIGSRIVAYTSKQLAKITAGVSRRLAAKMALKMAAMAGRVLVKLGSGPVGWALMIFEVISALMDLADLNNYNSYIANEELMKARDLFVYKLHEALTIIDEEYPMLFPYTDLFPEASLEASEKTTSYMFLNYSDIISSVEGADEFLENEFNRLSDAMDAGIDIETLELTEEEEDERDEMVKKILYGVRNAHAVEIDKYTFDTLQEILPVENRNEIFLVPSMSSEKTIGISITESAAERWNAEKKVDWFQYLDPFFPPNLPEKDWVPPNTAIFTDKYLIPNSINPGTVDAPNIITKTLSEPVTLAFPFGPLVTLCEKPRTSAQYLEPVNPQEFGVTFDMKTGVCDYTRAYCDRYVIDYKTKTWKDGTPYTECVKTKDQYWAELFLGENVVRDAKRYWSDPGEILTDLGDLYKQREEKYGTATAVLMTVADPLGVGEVVGGFTENMKQKMAGKDKYCITGDTCKYITAKHDGGNFMTWSARGADGSVYPHPQLGVQGEVKIGEDHTFYIPEGGKFRVKCDPGEGKDFLYDELTNNETKKFTCWNGKVNEPFDVKDSLDMVIDLAETGGEYTSEAMDVAEEWVDDNIGEPVRDWSNDYADNVKDNAKEVEEDCGSGGSAGECAGSVVSFMSSLFSDRRLKNNVKRLNIKSPIPGLDLYTWTWNEIAMSTYGLKGRDIGFIADEIPDKYISMDVYGYEYIRKNTPIHRALSKIKYTRTL